MAYTAIDDSALYFQVQLYTGNGGTQSITLDGSTDMQPDWVWIKNRSGTDVHALYDSVRGANKNLRVDSNSGEGSQSDGLTSFDSDGFSVGAAGSVNTNTNNFISFNWKGGGSASANSDGSTASSVSANTTAGFSVVSYTGAGATTYGHGLGATPNVIIIKKRTGDSGNNNWFVYHDKVITAGGSNKSFLTLNENGILAANGSATTFTSVSSTTFGVGTDDIISESSHTFIAYCFAEKKGHSKFGIYSGNNANDGTFIHTGFKPAFIIVKRTDSSDDWKMVSRKVEGHNPMNQSVKANTNAAEAAESDHAMDLLSNGFKFRENNAAFNAAGTYVYMAWAHEPFVTSGGLPTTAL